jgi:hypothetical protein
LSIKAGDAQAIQHLKQAIAEGKHWYIALLEAVKLWESPEEDYNGRHYNYLIANEAFDWLALAERLCEEIGEFVSEKERIDLLFFDKPPIELSKDEFRHLIGNAKYQAYLNYLYGILVEQFLILATTEEIHKGKRVLGLNNDGTIVDDAYQHIYGATQAALLKNFRKERHYRLSRSIGLSELNEFIYWLFKYRLRRCDKSCVASDTEKALSKLHHYSKLRAASLRHSEESCDSSRRNLSSLS